jgi:ASC-1-like (ASCH) protein
MLHSMGLYERPFNSIKKGQKIYEVRLNDEKRRKIQVGDVIEFTKVSEMDEKIKVKVLELRRYPSFEEMYKDIPFSLFDCDGWTLEEMINSTYEIYSKEQEQHWGALAIKIQLIES